MEQGRIASSVTYTLDWLADEVDYTLEKFGPDGKPDDERIYQFNHGASGVALEETWWYNQINNYLHRAALLGLDTPGGRQAMAKAVATSVMMLAACTRVFGALPEPGVTSGQNLDKLRQWTQP